MERPSTENYISAWNENGLKQDTALLLNHQHIYITFHAKYQINKPEGLTLSAEDGCHGGCLSCADQLDFLKFPSTWPCTDTYKDPCVSMALLNNTLSAPVGPCVVTWETQRKDDAASYHDWRTMRPFGRVPTSAPYLCSISVIVQHMKLWSGLCMWRISGCFSVTVRGLTADLVPSLTNGSGVRCSVNTQTNH